MFALYECQDGTFVIVPRDLSPPVSVSRTHGDHVCVSYLPRHVFDSPLWDEASRKIESTLHAIVPLHEALVMFDLSATSAAHPETFARARGDDEPIARGLKGMTRD